MNEFWEYMSDIFFVLNMILAFVNGCYFSYIRKLYMKEKSFNFREKYLEERELLANTYSQIRQNQVEINELHEVLKEQESVIKSKKEKLNKKKDAQ